MTAATIPGYIAGPWNIAPTHSEVAFSVRHMMVSKVRGKFTTFTATIITADDPSQSSVTAEVDLSSIDTGNEQRDAHLRSVDFFETDAHQVMSYHSSAVTPKGDDWHVDGE